MTGQRVIAIGGGKGGVGKSFVAVNLAVTIAKSGQSVVMLDADLGGANLHTLFGIMHPTHTVHDFLEGRASTLEGVTLETSVEDLRIISGTCDVLGSADIAQRERRRLLEALSQLNCDCLVVDVGAGTNVHTVDLFNAADVRMVVMTPELTSAQNAYGFLKVAVYRRLQRALQSHPGAEELRKNLGTDPFKLGSTMEKVDTFLSIVESEGLGLEDPLRMLLREFNPKLVGNMLTNEKDRNVVWALKRMIDRHLSLDVDVAAAFRSNSKVRRTVNTGTPLTASGSEDYDVAEFERLARTIMGQDMKAIGELREAISSSLGEGAQQFAFGLDGIEVVELEEITDPTELLELQRADAESRVSAPPPVPPPPKKEEPSGRRVVPLPPEEPVAKPAAKPLEAPAPQAPPRDPEPRAAAGGQARFAAELEKVGRRGTRGTVHVEVELAGHWFFGKLVSVDDNEAVVAGVHPFFVKDGSACGLRFVTMNEEEEAALPPPAQVSLHGYDEVNGRATLRFCDPGSVLELVTYVREGRGRHSIVLAGAA